MNGSRVARLALAVAVACAVVPATAAAASPGVTVPGGEGALRVDATDLSAYPTVSLTLTWPAPPPGVALDVPVAVVDEAGETRAARVKPMQDGGLAVALVVDTSGSMAGVPMEAAKGAATAFVDRLPPTAQVTVVGFGETPRLAAPLTTDRATISAALAGLTAVGSTALYDAVELALVQLPLGVAARRHLIVLSDGGDTASFSTIEAVISRLSAAGVGVDVAELTTTDGNHDALGRLAQAGGGSVVAAADPAGLTAIYDALGRTLASQYQVEFEATGHGSTPVRVTLEQGGQRAAIDLTLDLPPPPATIVPATTTAIAAAPAAVAPPGSPPVWALVLGGALCFFALLIFLAPLGRARRTVSLDPYRVAAASPSSTMSRLAERVTVGTDRALERHGRRSRLNDALERAGIILRPGEFIVLAASAALAGLALGSLLGNPLMGVVLAAVALISARLLLSMLTSRRQRRFNAQLGDNLQLMASTLRSGYGLLQALDVVAQEAEAPSREEFRRVVVEARLGRDLNESLRSAAARVGGEDFAWVAQAMEINREVGGELSVVLENVAATIRERDRVRRQVKALSAEGRLSAYVLVALPIGLGLMISVINPEYMAELTHGAGLVLSLIGVAMLAVGSFWLSRMVKVDY